MKNHNNMQTGLGDEVLFILEDLGLDIGDKDNLDTLSFYDLLGYLNERKQALRLKSLKLPFESKCLDPPQEWKRYVGGGPDFDLGPKGLMEAKFNLGDYVVTPFMFLRDWIRRFLKVDPKHKRPWTVNPLKARWGREVWDIIKSLKVRVVQSYGTDQTAMARLKRLFHLHQRGTAPSPADRGYLPLGLSPPPLEPLEPLVPVSPVSSPDFSSIEAFHGKGPPKITPNPSVSDIWFCWDREGQLVRVLLTEDSPSGDGTSFPPKIN